MKPGGMALVGLPTGPDRIEFNAHRLYGPIQLPHFFANWEQVYTESNLTNVLWYFHHNIFVVKKPVDTS